MLNAKKRGLGKGLNELGINELLSENNSPEKHNIDFVPPKLPIDLLQPGKYQPRRDMNPELLDELANSIRQQGIIQPLIVRKISETNFEIIAGERRWRAAQKAGLLEVPVVIKQVSDEAAMAMGLIENIQREDLNPVEEAHALYRLINEFGMTHEQAADAVGKARVTVTNLLRVLNLNPDVKFLLENRQLELGHAKILLSTTGIMQSELAKNIANKQLSVREAELLIRNNQNSTRTKPSARRSVDPNIARLQTDLSDKLGAAVKINDQNGKGQLVIHYNTLEELEGILEHIK